MMDKDFTACTLADDLLLLTLDMCDRESKRPRTPKRLHRSLVDRIILTACAIQEETILANETDLNALREELKGLLEKIKTYLNSIGLTLNPKTTIEYGKVDFLGFTHIVTEDGKILLRLQNGKKKAKKRELKMIVRKLAAGELTPENVQVRYQGWRRRALRAGCRNAVFEMDRHFVLLLHKAGYRTRTTMKGVEIIAESN